MGFLDTLCDYDAGEAEVSWSSFWRLENTCALTTLGAAVPFVISVLICVAVISRYRANSSKSSSSNKMGYYRQLNINDSSGETSSVLGGGNEESKDGRLHHEDGGFATSALEPLLGNHSNGDVVMVDSPESVVEAGTDCDGVGSRGTTPKKGTGVHWLKLLLYWSQAAFHLSVGCYDLFDGHADDPYKCECHQHQYEYIPYEAERVTRIGTDSRTRFAFPLTFSYPKDFKNRFILTVNHKIRQQESVS